MKDLAVIIVNYNVKHFLEQCLLSVKAAMQGLDCEVWVVDNNSVDGSQQMVREKFPWVHHIDNKDNVGFSRANNQAIEQSNARYVLLLNPDTVVEETTFTKCIEFMDAHPDAGGLGVKMIDGNGKFLPESKRALPTPWVAFYKIFGLATLFPKSKKFGKYHLTYLSKEENHSIEVLSGAFMLMRQEALDKVGLLDETFFMYGEDIDLSYRIILGGYKNYYFSETKIIHYKGESTKKATFNYVRTFYNAMIIFAKKHFGKNQQRLYVGLINFAVYFRAFLAILSRIVNLLAFPALEAGMVYGAIIGVKEYWEYIHKLQKDGIPYPEEFNYIAAPVYTLLFISFLALAGGYRKPYKFRPLQLAALSGFITIATVSYLFPEINFSRMIVGLSSVAMVIITLLNRNIINLVRTGSLFFADEPTRTVVIVGDEEEAARIERLIRSELDYPVAIEGLVLTHPTTQETEHVLGSFDQLGEILSIYKIEEVIFANKSLSSEQIMDSMSRLDNPHISYKIVPPEADYLVGPQVIHDSLHNRAENFRLEKKEIRFKKRVFDAGISLVLMLAFPATFWLYRKPGKAIANLWNVLTGQYHLVGYIRQNPPGLPKIKAGVLNMLDRVKKPSSGSDTHSTGLDRQYARTYSLELDLEILLKGLRNLGG